MGRIVRAILAIAVPAALFVVTGFFIGAYVDVPIEWVVRSAGFSAAAAAFVLLLGVANPAVKSVTNRTRWSLRPYLVPREPPPPPAYFVGRDQILDEVTELIRRKARRRILRRRPFVLLLHGGPGVGKSGLALRAAASVTADFPNGVVYASMTEVTSADKERMHDLLGDLVDSLQGPGDKVPRKTNRRARALRRLTRARPRLLFVLDDATDADAVERILPARAPAVVLITSRQNLELNGAVTKREVSPLPIDQSIKLLRQLLGVAAPEAQPAGSRLPDLRSAEQRRRDDEMNLAIRRVAVSAAGYPLALHLAVRAIANRGLWALHELTADLPEDEDQVPPDEARRRMLDLSVKVLTDEQKRALQALVRMPSPTFVPWMVKALAGLEGTEDDAWLTCDRLADQRLLERIARDAAGVVRLRLPDRVREYLEARHGRPTPEQSQQASQLLDAYRAGRHTPTVEEILQMLNTGKVAKALDEARGALSDAALNAAPLGPNRALDSQVRNALAALAVVLAELGGLDDAMEMATAQERAREETGQREPPPDAAEVRIQRSLGKLQRRAGRPRQAERTLALAHSIAVRVGDLPQQVLALRELAIAQSVVDTGAKGIDKASARLDEAKDLIDAAPEGVLSTDQASYLECRLIEGRIQVLLNGSGKRRAGKESLEAALEEIDRAMLLLPAKFELWRAWLIYHQARVLSRLADDARQRDLRADKRRDNLEEADDGEVLTAAEHARRLGFTARQTAEAALNIFSAMSHRYGTARCRLEIGRSLLAESPGDAIAPLETARETFFFCGDRRIEAEAAVALAEARALDRGDTAAAVDELEFAARIVAGVRDRARLRQIRAVRRKVDRVRRTQHARGRRHHERDGAGEPRRAR